MTSQKDPTTPPPLTSVFFITGVVQTLNKALQEKELDEIKSKIKVFQQEVWCVTLIQCSILQL